MVAENDKPAERKVSLCNIKFWDGLEAEIDLEEVARRAIPVKGIACEQPTRFVEVFADTDKWLNSYRHKWQDATQLDISRRSWADIEASFFPRLDGKPVHLVEGASQPPFAWREASVDHLCTSFTYNTNAFFRILTILQSKQNFDSQLVEPLLDQACLVLSQLYRAKDSFLLRNLNNNFNMYLISKVVECLVGRTVYDSNRQEAELTGHSLSLALSLVEESRGVPVAEKMALAVGRGVAFLESRVFANDAERRILQYADDVSYGYFRRPLAIDHREKLIRSIADASGRGSFALAAILDDTAESVDDLAWMMDLMRLYPYFRVHLLVNSAQISVNFSSEMLSQVLRHPSFQWLREKLGSQFFVTEIYCPFISFQTNYLPAAAERVIAESDAVYIKGANFFETCQIQEKDTYHAFVVYGPVSKAYTGLQDFDPVFVHLPAGVTGYHHKPPPGRVTTLLDVVGKAGGSVRCGNPVQTLEVA
jgi:hypothetical protein